MDNLEYRKEVWAILKEFRDSKVMTLEEVTTKIITIPTPKKGNPYVGMATREDGTLSKTKKRYKGDILYMKLDRKGCSCFKKFIYGFKIKKWKKIYQVN